MPPRSRKQAGLQKTFKLTLPGRMPKLAQGLGFNLPDALPGHLVLPADLLQRAGKPIVEPVAQLQNTAFPLAQAMEHLT